MKSIFKLSKLHLFLIVVFVLLASSLGMSVVEYFHNKTDSERYDPALEEGSNYDPFNNSGNYDCIVGDLEDIIIPERRKRKHHNDSHKKEKKSCNKKKHSSDDYDRDGVDRDKYILKSEIVPPVCPKCPDSRTCPRQKPCPPCAPCGRCPEPAFTCKKVPNYSVSAVGNSSRNGGMDGGRVGGIDGMGSNSGGMVSGSNNTLPMPQLNSFAAFN